MTMTSLELSVKMGLPHELVVQELLEMRKQVNHTEDHYIQEAIQLHKPTGKTKKIIKLNHFSYSVFYIGYQPNYQITEELLKDLNKAEKLAEKARMDLYKCKIKK